MLREIVEGLNEGFYKIDKFYKITKDKEVSFKSGSIASYDGSIKNDNGNKMVLTKGTEVHAIRSQDGSMGEIYYYKVTKDGKNFPQFSAWGGWDLSTSSKEISKSQSKF